MGFTADILRTNAGVTNEWLHSIKCHQQARSTSEHAQDQSILIVRAGKAQVKLMTLMMAASI